MYTLSQAYLSANMVSKELVMAQLVDHATQIKKSKTLLESYKDGTAFKQMPLTFTPECLSFYRERVLPVVLELRKNEISKHKPLLSVLVKRLIEICSLC